jgi:hypothetical protein
MQVLLFGFIGALLVVLRREIFRVQRRMGEMMLRLDKMADGESTPPPKEPQVRETIHAGH